MSVSRKALSCSSGAHVPFVLTNPYDLLFEADLCLAEGNLATAAFLVQQAYEAFDVADAIDAASAVEMASDSEALLS